MKISQTIVSALCVSALATCGLAVPVAGAATGSDSSQAVAQSEDGVFDDGQEDEDLPNDPMLLINVPDENALATNKGKTVRKQSYFKKGRTAQSVATCRVPFTLKVSSKDKKGCLSCSIGKCTKIKGSNLYKRVIKFTVKKGAGKGTYTVKLKGTSPASNGIDAGSSTASYKVIVK